MKRYMYDVEVAENNSIGDKYCLLKLGSNIPFPDMMPGQFVQVRVDNSPTVFLRRPISINYMDRERNELWLLIHKVGEGTRALSGNSKGSKLNLLLPLGNSFSIPSETEKEENLLLVGGGIGTAPLLFLGSVLKNKGYRPTFLLGARTGDDLMQIQDFQNFGTVYTTTEDGSHGEKGFVVHHSILGEKKFNQIYTCGPKAMMIAVAKYAANNGITCEVSLENTMACGIGACLCCVEETENGNKCVCTEGPVFNINKLKWLI